MERIVTAEWLDTDAGSAVEVAGTLSDLRDFNRWLGGVRTTQWMLEQIARQSKRNAISLLEVAAGSGETPAVVQSRLKKRGIDLDLTLLDRAPTHLAAGSQTPFGRQKAVASDAMALPFRDGSFDVVNCCLFIHHLSPPQVIAFTNEALRVCRVAVLINDIVRHPIHWMAALAGTPLYRSRITRNDAPASVRQAYTQREMELLLAQSAAVRVEIYPRYFFRMAATAWKA